MLLKTSCVFLCQTFGLRSQYFVYSTHACPALLLAPSEARLARDYFMSIRSLMRITQALRAQMPQDQLALIEQSLNALQPGTCNLARYLPESE